MDYRGFGLSTGAPTERGVVADGVALVNFVLNLGIPPSRIVILGQSLGTAVSSAVALHFADPVAAEKHLLHEPIYKSLSTEESANVENHAEFGNSVQKPIDFAAVILVASFSSLPKLLLNYRIGGFLPLLSPLRPYPRFQKFFLGRLHDTWNTSSRLTALTSTIVNSPERSLRLHILHARNDWDIPWRSGEENFQRAEEALYPTLNPNEEGKVEKVEGTGVKVSGEIEDNQRKEVWLGESRRIELTFEILRFGGEFGNPSLFSRFSSVNVRSALTLVRTQQDCSRCSRCSGCVEGVRIGLKCLFGPVYSSTRGVPLIDGACTCWSISLHCNISSTDCAITLF